jgi:hypothetical protein
MRRLRGVEAAGRNGMGWDRTGQDGRGSTDAGGSAGAGDANTVVGGGRAAWCEKVRQSSTAGKPTAALVGVAEKKADVAQPLDPRAKVGAGVE